MTAERFDQIKKFTYVFLTCSAVVMTIKIGTISFLVMVMIWFILFPLKVYNYIYYLVVKQYSKKHLKNLKK